MSSTPPLTPLAAAVLHVGRPERVLQVACGDGDGALFLAREFPTARVRGIDADADLVHAATARVGLDPEGRVAFKVGGPRRIPFPDDQFDLVAALDARPKRGRGGPRPAPRRPPDPRRDRGRPRSASGLGGLAARPRPALARLRDRRRRSAPGAGSFTVARLTGA